VITKNTRNERWRGRREMNDEKKVKASGGGTQVAYIILKKNVLKENFSVLENSQSKRKIVDNR